MKNMMKKIVAVATALTVSVWLVGPGVAQAVTAEELQAQIDALLAQLAALQTQLAALQEEAAPTGVPVACTGITFDRNLKQGMTGSDVKCLQALLNTSTNTQVATTGAGSPGNETSYFGSKTKAAVIKFQEKYAADVLTPLGLTAGTGFVGSATRAKLNALLVAAPDPPAPPVGTGLTVALAPDTPAAGTIIAGQAIAELARFTFTNGDAAEVKVTKVVLTRTGVSADTTLSNVYLYDGAKRITELASVSAGKITFVNAAGIFTIPAGGSKTISVKSDIAASTGGQTVGVRISAAADIESNATALSGTFPFSGNLMSVATAPTLATVAVGATGITSTTVPAGSTDYTVWQTTLNISNRAVDLRSLQLRQIGSVRADDIQNFRLFVKGEQKATAVLAADNTLTFDLTASPVNLVAGPAAIEVRADIISGSARTFSFALWRASDLDVQDSEFKVNVLATGPFPASAPTTLSHTIGTGSLTIVRAADSPVGPVVENGTDVPLAKFTLTAFGESVRVERLRVDVQGSGFTPADITFRNGRLLADGVQVGSTLALTAEGITYELGAALVVEPGKPKALEVRADIYDTEGTNDIGAGDALIARLVDGVLTNNAQTLESLTLLSVPGTPTPGNTLAVLSGALVVARNAAYGSQNVVAGTNDVKIGSFVLQTGSAEAINVSNYQVGITGTAILTNLANLRISESTLVRGSVASTNNYPVSQQLAANSTKTVDVFVDIGTGVSTGDTIISSLAVTARGVTTGNDVSVTAVTGQTMTVATGALTMTRDAGTPVSAIVIGGTTAPVAKYRFDATNESFTIIEAKVAIMVDAAISAVTSVKIGTATVPLVVAGDTALNQSGTGLTTTTITVTGLGGRFKVGQRIILTPTGGTTIGGATTPVTVTLSAVATDTLTWSPAIGTIAGAATATVTPINGTATFTGAILSVPKDGSAVMTVEATFNNVATGFGTSGSTPIFSLTSYTARSASGAITGPVLYGVSPLTVAAADSNTMVLRRTVPTVTLNTAALSNALGGMDHEVLKVDIAANAAEDVDIREIRVTPTITGTVSGGSGIAIFQGTIERGRVMNESSTSTATACNLTSLSVATGHGARFQTGQKITITGWTGCTTTPTNAVGRTISVSGDVLTLDTALNGAGTNTATLTVSPAGYTTGNTYRVPLTAAIVAKGTSSLFTVKADTTGLTTAGNSIQIRILADTTAGTTGNLIWREGTVTTDINGNLVRELPITGPALIRP
jgi:hypothetical protein